MTCPNCGQEYEGDRCPNCGRPRASGGSRTAAVIVAVLLVLPCAAFGACAALVAGGTVGLNDRAAWWYMVPTVFGFFAALVGLCLWVRKLWKG